MLTYCYLQDGFNEEFTNVNQSYVEYWTDALKVKWDAFVIHSLDPSETPNDVFINHFGDGKTSISKGCFGENCFKLEFLATMKRKGLHMLRNFDLLLG